MIWSFIAKGEKAGRACAEFGDVMFALLKSFFHLEFFAECGRLLLLTISASYVGANVRRLAAKHGWDHHLLYLVYCIGTARGARSANPDVRLHIGESLDSGSGPSDHPGMTT